MPDHLRSPDRRRVLTLFAGLPVLGRAGPALAASVPPLPTEPPLPPLKSATVLVPGPEEGAIDRWARLVEPALAQAIAPGARLHQTTVGGPDGVTAANQFQARGTLDGRTLLMAPGEAVLAWLVGDPRAKFDVSRWVAVIAAVSPAVVVGRPGILASGRPIRIAAASPGGVNLPAVLGIELLGARAQLMPELTRQGAIQAGLSQNRVDAVLLRGHNVVEQVRTIAPAGAVPLFSLGIPDASGRLRRPPDFPDLPRLDELYASLRRASPTGPLFAAWRAAAIASQLAFSLVLPVLTPAPMVAMWRRAGVRAMAALDIRALTASLSVQPLSGPVATACGDALSPHVPALIGLRQWLAERFNWRPT